MLLCWRPLEYIPVSRHGLEIAPLLATFVIAQSSTALCNERTSALRNVFRGSTPEVKAVFPTTERTMILAFAYSEAHAPFLDLRQARFPRHCRAILKFRLARHEACSSLVRQRLAVAMAAVACGESFVRLRRLASTAADGAVPTIGRGQTRHWTPEDLPTSPAGLCVGGSVPSRRLQQDAQLDAIAKPARTNFVLACQSICTPGRLETRIPSGKHARGTI